MSDFDQLVAAIGSGDLPPASLPAVSFLKAPGYQDGHAAYSDPIDEQQFVVNEINALQQTPGLDEHRGRHRLRRLRRLVRPRLQRRHNPSQTRRRRPHRHRRRAAAGSSLAGQQGRCGYGPRLPLLVDLAVGQAQRRRPHPDRPVLDLAVHRGQLGPRHGSPGSSDSDRRAR